MCGRAAQTYDTAQAAAQALGAVLPPQGNLHVLSPAQGSGSRQNHHHHQSNSSNSSSLAATVKTANVVTAGASQTTLSHATMHDNDTFQTDEAASVVEVNPAKFKEEKATIPVVHSLDNFNLSPGMDAMVIWYDRTPSGTLRATRQIWGLVPRGGTRSAPLSGDTMAQHFALRMFNARSDTLYQKTTFARLAKAGKTCVVALDGYFEWNTEGGKRGGPKQPYFIYPTPTPTPTPSDDNNNTKTTTTSSSKPYLLVAGLWTSVPTGHAAEEESTSSNVVATNDLHDTTDTPSSHRRQQPPPSTAVLETFSMITTDACPSLQWLHHRMPLCIWDDQLALQWLQHPSERVLHQLDQASRTTPEGSLQWHAVTKAMSSLKFRDVTAIQAIPKLKTVTSFFTRTKKKTTKPTTMGTTEERTTGSSGEEENVVLVSAATPQSWQTDRTSSPRKKLPLGSPPFSSAVASHHKRRRSDHHHPTTTTTVVASPATTTTATKKRKPAGAGGTRSTPIKGPLDAFVTRRPK